MTQAHLIGISGSPRVASYNTALLRAAFETLPDGVVASIATPEYNYSVTGATKNAIDWFSGGPESPLDFKLAAIIGIGGGSGTARSREHRRRSVDRTGTVDDTLRYGNTRE